jgi:hypothetical protein
MELFGNTQMLALGDDGEAFDLQVRGAALCCVPHAAAQRESRVRRSK